MKRTVLTLLGTLVAAGSACAAGQVEVQFRPIEQLRDVGRGTLDSERNVQTLAGHFKSLGAQLPDGQTLQIEVLDVDMAGELKPFRQGGELRVLKGGADWPSLSLRWTLKAGDTVLRSGDERISDMNYLAHSTRGRDSEMLVYEQRLIDQWFDAQFRAKTVARTP
jgi:hypothetical protein